MDEKAFELLTKMYSEMQEMKSEIKEMKQDISNINHTVVRIENSHGKRLEALFEGYQAVYEKQQEHDKRFDTIESKLEKHDLEIKVIKAVK